MSFPHEFNVCMLDNGERSTISDSKNLVTVIRASWPEDWGLGEPTTRGWVFPMPVGGEGQQPEDERAKNAWFLTLHSSKGPRDLVQKQHLLEVWYL